MSDEFSLVDHRLLDGRYGGYTVSQWENGHWGWSSWIWNKQSYLGITHYAAGWGATEHRAQKEAKEALEAFVHRSYTYEIIDNDEEVEDDVEEEDV